MMTPEQEQKEMKSLHEYVDHFNNGYNIERLINDKDVSDKEKNTLKTVVEKLREAKLDSEKSQAFEDGRKQFHIELEKAKYKDQLKEKQNLNDRSR